MIRLIACDIDGTLLRGTQREISPAVFREVVRLGKQGVRFCPASGRQYHSLRGLFAPIASRLYYVCENGAVVFGPGDPGPILAKETMEREQALELCREILDMDGCEVLISGAGLERVIWFPSTTRSRRASKPVRVRITPAFLLLEARPSR